MTDPGRQARLREALLKADYTVHGCHEALGPPADAALARNQGVPALRATGGGSPRETLIRLFTLQQAVPVQAAADALPLDEAVSGGIVARDGDTVRALVDVRPYGDDDSDWYVVSDHGEAPAGVLPAGAGHGEPVGVRPDHVLGVGLASLTLAGLTVRPQVASALDLGTGCGVQALHASRHAGTVTATDVNPRALACARLTLALSGVSSAVDLVEGPLFEPVGHRRFDLVVSNPPFVVSPQGAYAYRDSGLPGDDVCRRLVAEAPTHLNDGGWCQLLANWLHVEGEDWRERLAHWVVPTGCDAWVVQRDVQDPASYVEHWLRDAGDGHEGTDPRAYAARYEAWLEHLGGLHAEGVGFGWITLRASGSDQPFVRIEEITHPVRQPLGGAIAAAFARQDFLRDSGDDALLGTPLAAAPELLLEQTAVPSYDAAGWRPASMRIRLTEGMCPSGDIDPVGAAVLAGSDGTRPVREVLAEVARGHGLDETTFPADAVGVVRMLLEEGFLLPPPAV